MKLVISEKQLNELVTQLNLNKEITEQGDGAPEAGTSSDGEQKTGASKWESGVTRGPANQIGVTKWADSYKITRGKANPLSEQMLTPYLSALMTVDAVKNDTPYTEYTTPWGDPIIVPSDAKTYLITSKTDRRKILAKDKILTYGERVYWKIGYDNKLKQPIFEPAPDLSEMLPNNSLLAFTTKDGKFWTFILFRTGVSKWDFKYKAFMSNVGGKLVEYDQDDYINKSVSTRVLGFIDEWGETILQVVASIGIGIATGGASLLVQAIAQVSVGAVFAAKQYFVDKDSVGAGLSLVLSIIPVSGVAARMGFGQSFKALQKYIPKLANAKDVGAVNKIVAKMLPEEQVLIKKAMRLPKGTLTNVLNDGTAKMIVDGIKNKTINVSGIPFKQKTWLWETIFNLSGAGVALFGSVKYKQKLIEEQTEKLAKLSVDYYSENGFQNENLVKELKKLAEQYNGEKIK